MNPYKPTTQDIPRSPRRSHIRMLDVAIVICGIPVATFGVIILQRLVLGISGILSD